MKYTVWSPLHQSSSEFNMLSTYSDTEIRLALARIQDEVSDVNEDGDVGLGGAVWWQEALECLHLIQNS